jgi:hypothetical protein
MAFSKKQFHLPMDFVLIVQPCSYGKTPGVEAKQQKIRADAGFIGKLGVIGGEGGSDGCPGG